MSDGRTDNCTHLIKLIFQINCVNVDDKPNKDHCNAHGDAYQLAQFCYCMHAWKILLPEKMSTCQDFIVYFFLNLRQIQEGR